MRWVSERQWSRWMGNCEPRLSRVRWRTLLPTRWERTRRKVKYCLPARERVRERQMNILAVDHGGERKSSIFHILWYYIADSGRPQT